MILGVQTLGLRFVGSVLLNVFRRLRYCWWLDHTYSTFLRPSGVMLVVVLGVEFNRREK